MPTKNHSLSEEEKEALRKEREEVYEVLTKYRKLQNISANYSRHQRVLDEDQHMEELRNATERIEVGVCSTWLLLRVLYVIVVACALCSCSCVACALSVRCAEFIIYSLYLKLFRQDDCASRQPEELARLMKRMHAYHVYTYTYMYICYIYIYIYCLVNIDTIQHTYKHTRNKHNNDPTPPLQYLHGVLGDYQFRSQPDDPYTPEMLEKRRKKQYAVERELMERAQVFLYAVVSPLCVSVDFLLCC